MHNFKELKVWQKSIDLTSEIYEVLSGFPSDEKLGLISQIKRAAVSIPSTIAEGSWRNSGKEFKHFLAISLGSSFEIETQFIIANRLGLIHNEKMENFARKISEIQKMIYMLERSINT